MNFNNIRLTPVNKQLVVHSIKNSKPEKINFTLTTSTPFGNEKHLDNTYINWTLDNEMLSLLEVVEQNFYQELKQNYIDWTFKTSIRGKEGYNKLLRTKVIDDLISEPNKDYDVTIVLESIWLHRKSKTMGIMWHTTKIIS